MHFVDECQLRAEAGAGGDGAIAFRREKFVPLGGPAGGDGGKGGDIVLVADPGKSTLADLTHRRILQAAAGQNGEGQDKYGKAGKDLLLGVPLGTVVVDANTNLTLGELTHAGDRLLVARGGKGGKGNIHFATSTDRAPRKAEPGGAGEKRNLRLELKVMADVGLLGFPNVGKSTFISCVSSARPKIADYPFTTLEPHLGVVTLGDRDSGLGNSFVVADIPGLVPGAAEGQGLGHRFLRHVERTRLLLHLVTLSVEAERDPVSDYKVIRSELKRFNPDLATRPEVVVLSMGDLPDVSGAYEELKERFRDELSVDLKLVSSVTRRGLDALLRQLLERLGPNASQED
jgi:GTPase